MAFFCKYFPHVVRRNTEWSRLGQSHNHTNITGLPVTPSVAFGIHRLPQDVFSVVGGKEEVYVLMAERDRLVKYYQRRDGLQVALFGVVPLDRMNRNGLKTLRCAQIWNPFNSVGNFQKR